MLKNITSSRLFWLSILTFSWGLVGFAVFYQNYFEVEPCYLCIIQRIALIIIGFFAILPLIKPSNPQIRQFGYLGWFIGSVGGLIASIKLVALQSSPKLVSSCGVSSDYLIENFGILEALPILFEGSGDCSSSAGNFLSITFEQWSMGLFILSLSTLLALITARLVQRLKE